MRICRYFSWVWTFFAGIARSARVGRMRACFDALGRRIDVERTFAVARGSARLPSCEDCFFARNALCALPDREPCATFRPHHPDGLRPPEQMRLVFRTERRTRAAWSFPTAAEQAALHA